MSLKWWAWGQVIILTTFHECYIFYPVYVSVCTSYIHWKLCRCLYCFYPIIFSAKYKRSMLNYFAAVIVWKTAWWDYETIEERWNSKVRRTWTFLEKSVPRSSKNWNHVREPTGNAKLFRRIQRPSRPSQIVPWSHLKIAGIWSASTNRPTWCFSSRKLALPSASLEPRIVVVREI